MARHGRWPMGISLAYSSSAALTHRFGSPSLGTGCPALAPYRASDRFDHEAVVLCNQRGSRAAASNLRGQRCSPRSVAVTVVSAVMVQLGVVIDGSNISTFPRPIIWSWPRNAGCGPAKNFFTHICVGARDIRCRDRRDVRYGPSALAHRRDAGDPCCQGEGCCPPLFR